MGILVPKSHAQPSSSSQMTLVEGESSSGMSWVTIDVLKYHAQNNLGNKEKNFVCTKYLRFWFFEENKSGNSK